jgi:hypothetical protein
MKWRPNSHDFNKLVIKVKMHAKTYFLKFSFLYENTIWFYFFIFERLSPVHENKNIFFQCFDENQVF